MPFSRSARYWPSMPFRCSCAIARPARSRCCCRSCPYSAPDFSPTSSDSTRARDCSLRSSAECRSSGRHRSHDSTAIATWRRRSFGRYLVSGGVAAAAAIAMVALRYPPLQYAITHGRATGTFVLPGELAAYLIVLLPVAYVLGQVGRTRALRTASWIVLAIGIVALVMTYSRAGWMGFAAAAAFLVATRTRHGAAGAAAVIAAGVAGGVLRSSTHTTIRARIIRGSRFGRRRRRSSIVFR